MGREGWTDFNYEIVFTMTQKDLVSHVHDFDLASGDAKHMGFKSLDLNQQFALTKMK